MSCSHAASIVVLEDDALMRNLLVEWLSAEGYSVRTCTKHDCHEMNDADLAIVDVFMPRQEGASRLRCLQSEHPQTPLIAISGQFRPGLDRSATAADALGVRHVVAKPFSRQDLLAAVRDIVGPSGE